MADYFLLGGAVLLGLRGLAACGSSRLAVGEFRCDYGILNPRNGEPHASDELPYHAFQGVPEPDLVRCSSWPRHSLGFCATQDRLHQTIGSGTITDTRPLLATAYIHLSPAFIDIADMNAQF